MKKITILVVLVLVTLTLVISILVYGAATYGKAVDAKRGFATSEHVAPVAPTVKDFLRNKLRKAQMSLAFISQANSVDKFIDRTKFGPDCLNKVKHVNAFKPFELLFLDSLDYETAKPFRSTPNGVETAKPFRSTPNCVETAKPVDLLREFGVDVQLLENAPTMDFFMNSVSFVSEIFFIKATEDYRIEKGKLKYFSNFGEEATHIMYCFGNNFASRGFASHLREAQIIFKKEMPKGLDKYYVPENNSIICFTNKDTYSASLCKHSSRGETTSEREAKPTAEEVSRYLMVILIFGNCQR